MFAQLTRRDAVRLGALSLWSGAFNLHSAPAHAAIATRPPAKNCILIYLLGGPSHLDMWDLKPHAPAEIRGPFQPISTSVPGVLVCEHMPLLAQRADQLAIVRSLGFPNNDHPFMAYHTLTGRVSPVPLGANTVLPPSRSDDPHLGAIVSKFHHRDLSVPGYVAIPELFVRMGPQLVAGGGRAGFLGPQYDPLAINDDPAKGLATLNLPDDVSSARFDGRQNLLAMLDGRSGHSARQLTYQSQLSTASRLTRQTKGGLFDLDAEPVSQHERYGRDRFGQSLLLARRLVEHGVSFVAVHFNYMTKCDGWDTHKDNFNAMQNELLPMLDRGLSALLDDLAEQGRLEETLVVTMGEFGRTPKINADAGRDHWGPCGTAVFAGGPVQGGTVIGSSDAIGAYPTSRPVTPADVTATIFHTLGLDPATEMHDRLNRPLPLSTGQAIAELFS